MACAALLLIGPFRPVNAAPTPLPGSCPYAVNTIDFSKMCDGKKLLGGEYVSTEWSGNGLVLSSSGGFGFRPRIFNTSYVGNEMHGDSDLGSPNERCNPPGPGIGEGGEPDKKQGANCAFLGSNVLIIQENNKDYTIPDDNVDGGKIIFDFKIVAEYVYEMGLLDIDNTTSITVTSENGVSKTL